MKKINKLTMILFLSLSIIKIGNSQVTETKYEIVFDELTCEYSMYLHIIEGSAVTIQERLPLLSAIAMILPGESQGNIVETFLPSPTSWNDSNSGSSPGGDLNKTFFNVSSVGISGVFYPEMYAGDVLLLFKFTVSNNVQGVKGIRPYNGEIDNPGGGGAFGTSFLLGGLSNLHSGFKPTQFGSNYAQATGPSAIYKDKQTTLFPSVGGDWSQTNTNVTSFDMNTNIVTGLEIGRSLFTFAPSDNSCASSVVIEVLPDPDISESYRIEKTEDNELGNAFGDPAVIFGIYGTKEGVVIPRMTQEERICIRTPNKGLLVYQTSLEKGFYYFNGQAWRKLGDSISEGSSQNQNSHKPNNELSNLIAKQEQLNQKYQLQQSELKELQKLIEQQ